MSALRELRMYARFLRGLPGFLRNPIALEHARAAVVRRLADREAALLRFADRGLFAAPRSPYPGLMRLAGCEPGDLPTLVRSRGLEGALAVLREAGPRPRWPRRGPPAGARLFPRDRAKRRT